MISNYRLIEWDQAKLETFGQVRISEIKLLMCYCFKGVTRGYKDLLFQRPWIQNSLFTPSSQPTTAKFAQVGFKVRKVLQIHN